LKPEQKLEKIRSQVHLLENQAKSYEMLNGNDIYSSQYLNQSYVEAIRAKLAYLNELSNL
jgi:LysM repeat protein